MNFKVIVIGGGLAGSLLTNGLLNNGVEAKLYERDAANSKRDGYQIRLDGILKKFGQSAGSASTAPSIYSSSFRLLFDLTKLPSYSKSSAINRVVLRDEFLQPIRDAGKAEFGKAFSHYEIASTGHGSEKVVVRFADSSSDTGDVLVGADGSASKVNNQVGAKNLVEITSHWSFLCKGRLPSSRIEELPIQLQKGPIMVFSKGASMFYSLYLPPKKEALTSLNSSLEYDEEAAPFYWGLNIPKESQPYKEISDIPDRRQACLDYIRDWVPQFHKMLSIGETDDDAGDLYAGKLRASTKPPNNWRSLEKNQTRDGGHPRVWLIGDAIHAMQPSRGIGGNQAIQDCSDILPELLRLNARAQGGTSLSTDDIESACSCYEEKMFQRAFTWVQKSGGATMLNWWNESMNARAQRNLSLSMDTSSSYHGSFDENADPRRFNSVYAG